MEETKKRFPLRVFEVVLLVIVLSILFYYVWRFLVVHGLPDAFTGTYALLVVLAFDIAWIATIKLWPFEKIRIKIYLTLLILTLSSAFVTYLIAGYLLSGMMH